MANRRLHQIRSHYEPRISSFRANHEILDWASPRTQRLRFEALLANVPLGGLSLLDVGCGLGDLYALTRERQIPVDYTGVDILDKMIVLARKNHPEAHFVVADVFAANPFGAGAFDVVYCSGLFNLNLGNNLEFLATALHRFLELSRQTVAFNMLHHRAVCGDPRYFYHDPRHVRSVLESMDATCLIVDDYLDNDFTVICRKGKPHAGS